MSKREGWERREREELTLRLIFGFRSSLQVRRPFQFINSRIFVEAREGKDAPLVGEAQQFVLPPFLSRPISLPLVPPSHSHSPLLLVLPTHRDWHLWRRKYNLFLSRPSTDPTTGALVPAFDQFASIDERFWSWEFWLRDAEGRARGSVSRNFGGFGREIFTDTGEWVLRSWFLGKGRGRKEKREERGRVET